MGMFSGLIGKFQSLSGGQEKPPVSPAPGEKPSEPKFVKSDNVDVIISKSREFENTLIEYRKALYPKLKTESPQVIQLLDSIIDTTDKILHTTEKDPKLITSTREFLSYYLPSVVNIVYKYALVIVNDVDSAEGDKFQGNIENFLKEIDDAFDNQLDSMFKDDMLDASLDMQLLHDKLKTKGLLGNDDFNG